MSEPMFYGMAACDLLIRQNRNFPDIARILGIPVNNVREYFNDAVQVYVPWAVMNGKLVIPPFLRHDGTVA